MFGFYTPILILQAFCIYHAYQNHTDQKWYWLIIFFPGFGCLFYLFHHFYNRNTITNVTEGVKGVVNSNYRLEQLEKALRFNDSLKNKIALADAYMQYARYKDAVKLYSDCLSGFMADDPGLRTKLLKAHFLNGDYDETISWGKKLESEKSFKNAEEKAAYAWALHYQGKTDLAEGVFRDTDKTFTNYFHRLEYCKFLLATDKKDELKNKLSDLVEEFEHMKGNERRMKRNLIREVKDLYATHSVD
jgi:hypothetical protein